MKLFGDKINDEGFSQICASKVTTKARQHQEGLCLPWRTLFGNDSLQSDPDKRSELEVT